MNLAQPQAPIDVLVGSLDRARKKTLAFTLRTRFAWLVVDRDRRLGLQASIGVVFTLLLSLLAPMTLVSVSPALFGIPHVASDIRYLVLRRPLPASWIRATIGFCTTLFVLRLLEGLTAVPLARPEAAIAGAWLISAAWVSGRGVRRGVLVAAAIVLSTAAVAYPTAARIVFAHLHNVVALALWVMLFRRSRRAALMPLALVVGGAALILAGGGVDRALAHPSLGMSLGSLASILAPGVPGKLGLGIALSYVFLQGVHYAVWLGWIPQDDVRGEGTITFQMSVKSATSDFGVRGLKIIGILSVTMLAASMLNVQVARSAYLSLATFHGYLELAALAFFLGRGRVD